MLAGTAGAEVVNHGLERRKRRCAVGPDVSSVSFLFAGREDMSRGLIGVDDALGQNGIAQRIY